MPKRATVLTAKATVLSCLAVVVGTIAVLGSLLAGRLILAGNGFTPAHGYPTLSLAHGPTLRAAAGSIIYLVLIALLSLGVATALRDSATASGLILGLLYLFPLISDAVADQRWQQHLQQVAPMTAGLAVQATLNLHYLPISPGWASASSPDGPLQHSRRRTASAAARRLSDTGRAFVTSWDLGRRDAPATRAAPGAERLWPRPATLRGSLRKCGSGSMIG